MPSSILASGIGWLHLLAASIWTGGLVFYLLILLPSLGNIAPQEARKFIELAGLRFRALGILLLLALLLTGLALSQRALPVSEAKDALSSPYLGRILGIKVTLSLLLVLLGIVTALGPAPAYVTSIEAKDEARARRLGRIIMGASALALVLTLGITVCVALLHAGP